MGLFGSRKKAATGETPQEILGWVSWMTPSREHPDWVSGDGEFGQESRRLYAHNWPFYMAASVSAATLAHHYLRNPDSPVVSAPGALPDSVIQRIMCRARLALIIGSVEAHVSGDGEEKRGYVEISIIHLWGISEDEEAAKGLLRVVFGETRASTEPFAQMSHLSHWVVAPLGRARSAVSAATDLDLPADVLAEVTAKLQRSFSGLAEDVGYALARDLVETYGPQENAWLLDRFAEARVQMDEMMQEFADEVL